MNNKPERNSPCPCGSGKKFKKCCGLNLTPAEQEFFAPMPDDFKTGTKIDFYFDIFRAVMFFAERKGQVYFVDIWYSKQYGLNMEEKGRFYFLTRPMW